MSGSADPFGILATVIPIFILALFFGESRLPTNRSQCASRFGRFLIVFFGVAEAVALFGVLFGGPFKLLFVVTCAAVAGLVFLLLTAWYGMAPSDNSQDRRGKSDDPKDTDDRR